MSGSWGTFEVKQRGNGFVRVGLADRVTCADHNVCIESGVDFSCGLFMLHEHGSIFLVMCRDMLRSCFGLYDDSRRDLKLFLIMQGL